MTPSNEALKPRTMSDADFAAQLSKFAEAQEQMAAQAAEDSWHWHHRALADLLREAERRALSAPPPAVAPQGWQPIETAPKNNTDVLVSYHGLVRIAFWDTARGGQWSLWPGREKVEPTKWMPLPTAPEKSNG